MKALKNFSCNGVRKKAGESLSNDELEQLGSFKKDLMAGDLLGNGKKNEKPEPKDAPKEESEELEESKDDLEGLDKAGLMELAKDLGFKPHHNTGEDKLKDMVRSKLGA